MFRTRALRALTLSALLAVLSAPGAARARPEASAQVLLHSRAGADDVRRVLRALRLRLGGRLSPRRAIAVEARPADDPAGLLLYGVVLEAGCGAEVPEPELERRVQAVRHAAATRQTGRADAVELEASVLIESLPCSDPARAAARARDLLTAVGTLRALRGDAEAARDLFARALTLDPRPPRLDGGSTRVSGAIHAARLELSEPRPLLVAALAPGVALFLDGRPLGPGQSVDAVPGAHLLQIRATDGRVRGAWVRVMRSREVAWVADPHALLKGLPLEALPAPPRWEVVGQGIALLAPAAAEAERIYLLRGEGDVLALELAERRSRPIPALRGGGRAGGRGWLSVAAAYGGLVQPLGGSLTGAGGGFAIHSAGATVGLGRRVAAGVGIGVDAAFHLSAGSGPARPWLALRPRVELAPPLPGARPFVAPFGLIMTLPVSAEAWGSPAAALGGGIEAGVLLPVRPGEAAWLRLRARGAVARDLVRRETFVEVGGDVGIAYRF